MANRLANATSPYLQQHADNPVEWWEWTPEALEVARTLDRPILLSVGYAACHWCHVMAHESFEDAATAAYMNEHFINIKVDREERPDIDAVYMRATQAMTGHGGWPMTCVLTPDGQPFFAGTYFPPEPRQGQPAFTQILQALADAWENRRDEIANVSASVMEHLNDTMIGGGSDLTAAQLDDVVTELAKTYDSTNGGFGDAPKFPPSMILEFLLRNAARTGSEQALEMVAGTCEAMARGGMYDQLTGGFSRYSIDAAWNVPHFEKMLYDNAQLLRVYLHWWRQSGDPLAERIARETAGFMLSELRTRQGGFASALDADSDGHEGTFYVFNPNQLMRGLGVADGAWATQLLNVTGAGTFERGFSTLQLRRDPDDADRWNRVRTALTELRDARTRPARDDKVVAAWNGMAITGLIEAGMLLEEPAFIGAALDAANLLVNVHLGADVPGGFARTSRDGKASANTAVLDDYGCVAEAFLAVLGVTGDPIWLERARTLLDRVLEHFRDPEGGFFDTADDAEQLVVRPQDASDNAHPSGTSAVVHALINFAAITGEHAYREAALDGIRSAAVIATRVPRFGGWTLAAAEAVLAGPLEIAVVGQPATRRDLHKAALAHTSPGAVVVAAEPGADIPLIHHRDLIDGKPAAYVCRGFVCEAPITDPETPSLKN